MNHAGLDGELPLTYFRLRERLEVNSEQVDVFTLFEVTSRIRGPTSAALVLNVDSSSGEPLQHEAASVF
jgi:hypothetical protein